MDKEFTDAPLPTSKAFMTDIGDSVILITQISRRWLSPLFSYENKMRGSLRDTDYKKDDVDKRRIARIL